MKPFQPGRTDKMLWRVFGPLLIVALLAFGVMASGACAPAARHMVCNGTNPDPTVDCHVEYW